MMVLVMSCESQGHVEKIYVCRHVEMDECMEGWMDG